MNDVSLRDYVDSRIEAICHKFTIEIRSLKDLINKAEGLLQIRLEGLNEWREQNKDIISKFITRVELDLQVRRLNERVDELNRTVKELELDRAKLEGKADQKALMYTAIASAIGLIISIISFVMKLGG